MSDNRIKKIVILGGGTAGWMTAAALAKFMPPEFCDIELVESEQLPPVGVGEATIPQIQVFNQTLGIDEDDFIRKTRGTFKLGIEFRDWGALGDRYIHGFGGLGRNMEALPFHHFWCKMHREGKAEPLGRYCLSALAATQSKFMRPIEAGDSPLSTIQYAYHFDAGLYARYLRDYAEARGVTRTEGVVEYVASDPSTGHITDLTLKDGRCVDGELFIDCSGAKGLLIEEVMGAGFEDWGHWLPCDRAWAVASDVAEPLPSHTVSQAQEAGWQWRIPLQHRTGNGHVFSSAFMNPEQARSTLLRHLNTQAVGEPRLLTFRVGKRASFWEKNCIAIGLSSGFLEPLESTGIHLIQSFIGKLMAFFPDRTFSPVNRRYFNREAHAEYDRIRDFIILHYHATRRTDSAFWNYVRTMPIPDTLTEKLALFRANGYVHKEGNELFSGVSWAEVFIGQGILPERYHPLVDTVPNGEIERRLKHIERVIAQAVDYMPSHQHFLATLREATPVA